jgi:DNA-binding transcriptional regulator YiaG
LGPNIQQIEAEFTKNFRFALRHPFRLCGRIDPKLKNALTICLFWHTIRGGQAMKKLKNGWVEGSVKEFLGLSEADMEFIETRRSLSRLLKNVREKHHLTQVQVAARLRTSQSRVAKMEKADPTVSADLLLRSLFRLGLKRKQLAEAI